MKYLKLYEDLKTGYSIADYLDVEYGVDSMLVKDIILDLGELDLTSLAGIERIPNLKIVKVYRNKLTSIKEIENLTMLEFLSCVHNKITSLDGIEHCKELEHLGCYGNLLKNLDEIRHLPKLLELNSEISDWGNDEGNPWEYPLAKDLVDKFRIEYGEKNKDRFSSYEYQKWFIEERPEKVKDLEPIGFNEKIIEEYRDLLDFFNVKL